MPDVPAGVHFPQWARVGAADRLWAPGGLAGQATDIILIVYTRPAGTKFSSVFVSAKIDTIDST